MRQIPLSLALLASVSLAACSTTNWTPPEIAYDETVPPTPAVLAADPPRPVEIVQVPTPLPLPGQLQRVPPARSHAPEPTDPRARVEAANSAARVQPFRSGYFNAVQVYPYSEGALYQVYAAPGQVTDIALQAGEQLVGSGPVAAGDTVRWIIGDTTSGAGPTARVSAAVSRLLIAPAWMKACTPVACSAGAWTSVFRLPAARKLAPSASRLMAMVVVLRLRRPPCT